MKNLYNLSTQLLFIILLFVPLGGNGQSKEAITLEDIWQNNAFAARSIYGVRWMNSGNFYTSQVRTSGGHSAIVKYDILTGSALDTLFHSRYLKDTEGKALNFNSYILSEDEEMLLLETNSEAIYRRSSKAHYYVTKVNAQTAKMISNNGKISNPTFSPDAKNLCFTRDNNLFIIDLETGKETAITTDGKFNELIHGSSDWVYEEEFSITRCFEWSPDGKFIAYISFDESDVPEYNMQTWGELYPEDYRYKYPKAGEVNSNVTVSVYDLSNKSSKKLNLDTYSDFYVPRINWTNSPSLLSVRVMNRLQNQLDLLHWNVVSDKVQVVIKETNKAYVELFDDLTYLENGNGFIQSSESLGFKHLYLYGNDGKLTNAITAGNWEVDEVVGIDEKSKTIYFTSTEKSSTQRHLYSIQWNGKGKRLLTTEVGNHSVSMSPDCKYFLNYYSTISSPTQVSLRECKTGRIIKVLEDNESLVSKLEKTLLGKVEFLQLPGHDNTLLNAYRILPPDFDEAKKYPVLMHVYGGPGSQQVRNSWAGSNYLWHQLLVSKGYIIVVADNRGTGGRGEQFKKMTYGQLGKFETEDQIAVAKYLAAQPYVDSKRIGIWGWSYGGYMSSLSLMIGANYFKSAIAVAPVSNWRLYDTIYTERYLGLPKENASGYDDNSPNFHTDKLKGNFLLVHGTGDDNVHFQNSVELVNALVKSGKQFDSFYYPNRNHGIYGGNTRMHLYRMMTQWIEKNL